MQKSVHLKIRKYKNNVVHIYIHIFISELLFILVYISLPIFMIPIFSRPNLNQTLTEPQRLTVYLTEKGVECHYDGLLRTSVGRRGEEGWLHWSLGSFFVYLLAVSAPRRRQGRPSTTRTAFVYKSPKLLLQLRKLTSKC